MNDQIEYGIQPLDKIMLDQGLSNHDVVAISIEQITHKMVHKARSGRRLTYKIQMKILKAVNACCKNNDYLLTDIFNYDGK